MTILPAVMASAQDASLTFPGPVGDLPVVSDARWSAAWTTHSWVALLVWIILLVFLQLAAWPFACVVFNRFPDRGWGFARLLTIVISGYIVWLLASIEFVAFRAIWCGAAIVVTLVGSLVVYRLLGDRHSREELLRPWSNPTIIISELVFWCFFGIFVWFRFLNPDSYQQFWGGEKPMEFAHINAILRSAHFPPVDPWYANGYINYYYYGEYLVAFLTKLTGVPSEIAFNLAQPTIIALLASGVFSLGARLGKSLATRRRVTIASGLLGVLLVSVVGNLVVAARLIDRIIHGQKPVYEFGYWFWDPSRAVPGPEIGTAITEFPWFSGTFADLHSHVIALPLTVLILATVTSLAFDWRMVSVVATIPRIARREGAHLLLRLALLALLLGTLWPTNAWDLPMYIALTGIGLLLATRGISSVWRRIALAGGTLLGVGLLASILIRPFLTHYVALFSSVEFRDAKTPLVGVESHFGVFFLIITFGLLHLMTKGRSVPAWLATPFWIGAALGGSLILQWLGSDRSDDLVRIANAMTVLVVVGSLTFAFIKTAPQRSDFGLPPWTPAVIVSSGFLASVVLVLIDRPVPALYLGVGLVAGAGWLSEQETISRLISAMIAGGMLVGAALEIVFLADNLRYGDSYRMNSIFKFYNELWILFALSSALLVVRMALDWHATRMGSPDTAASRRQDRAWASFGMTIASVAIVAALAFTIYAPQFRLDQRFTPRDEESGPTRTLNANDWMNYGELQYTDGAWIGYRDDRAAIDWLNAHVDGSPVIAEASFGPYRCNGSRFSIATGLPDVIGWANHESQQRADTDFGQRSTDLRDLYTEPDLTRKREIIARYGIAYIIVGPTERAFPSIAINDCVPTDTTEGIAALESMVGSDLDIAFTSGGTTVYRVRVNQPD